MVGRPALIRRLRAAVLSGFAVIALLFGTAAPAQAHAGLTLTVQDDGHGAVSVDVSWSDGHPLTPADPIAGTLLALSPAGTQVGPAALRRLDGTTTVVYEGTLKPGSWQVTVDLATPGIGHCVADVVVTAGSEPAKPGSQRCGETVAPVAAPATEDNDSNPLILLFAAAAAIALGTVVAIMVSRRPRPAAASRRPRSPTGR